MKFAKSELSEYKTGEVCKLIGVSRSEYYRKERETDSEEKEIEKQVINCFKKNKGNYGRIRIRRELLGKGINVSEYRIGRILRQYGLVAKSGRTGRIKAPKATEQQYIEENLVKNKFEIRTINYLWCSDITELKCKGSKIYLCAIIDVATRRIVGWSIGKNQTQKIVQDAIVMAVGRNPSRPEHAVFHSDRGCQYTAKKTKELVEENGFRKSMSRPGTPSDNQPIESFWRTLELEMDDIKHKSYEEATRVIVDYIEMYYNSTRLHSGIGYEIPNVYCERKTHMAYSNVFCQQ